MPRKRRCISNKPSLNYFKPAGIPLNKIEEISISFVELEALRLKDLLNLEQIECAERMHISQPTFHRLLIQARSKVANALVNGRAIKLEDDKEYLFKE